MTLCASTASETDLLELPLPTRQRLGGVVFEPIAPESLGGSAILVDDYSRYSPVEFVASGGGFKYYLLRDRANGILGTLVAPESNLPFPMPYESAQSQSPVALAAALKRSLRCDVHTGIHEAIKQFPRDAAASRVATEALMGALRKATSREINELHRAIETFSQASEICDVAVERTKSEGTEFWLATAATILENMGRRAWPALRGFVRRHPDLAELFVRPVAWCEGVAIQDRIDTLNELARRGNRETRQRILEAALELPLESGRQLLNTLAGTVGDDVSHDARSMLSDSAE